MRRLCVSFAGVFASRFESTAAAGSKKYDLFGYEVDTNTAPWIEKIKACTYYDEAGSVLVDMNVKNCPPDLATYNAALEKILTAPSKQENPVERESKFCAMMDLIEEMSHRHKIAPNKDSWTYVMKACVQSGSFRLGYAVQRVMEHEFESCPSELVEENEQNAQKAKSDGKEHPGHLKEQVGLFDIKFANK